MIVYSTQLHFDVAHGMDAAWDVISRWSYRKYCRGVGSSTVPMQSEDWLRALGQPDGHLQPAAATRLRWGIIDDRRAIEISYPDENHYQPALAAQCRPQL
jgi:hypothetical protein